MTHRCAFGCKNTDVVMHVFPKPDKHPERFKVWVGLVGNLEKLSDTEFYKTKRVCDIHFRVNHRNRFNRLNALAVPPTLHLPHQLLETQQSGNIGPSTFDVAIASNSGPSIYTSQPGSISDRTTTNPMPSTSGQAVSTSKCEMATHCTHTCEKSIAPVGGLGVSANTAVINEHSYSIISKTKGYTPLRKGKPIYHVQEMKTQKIRIKYPRSEICRLHKKRQSFKDRLANAEMLSKDIAFQRITKDMTKPAKLFIKMQLQATKRRKGRRFTTEEKVLSLSFFKTSPRCYRLLSNYFALPSPKAMKRLVGKIKLTPGINPIIFEKIKKSIQHKNIQDRLCSLIFDKMSLTPHISYNERRDEIEGFSCNNNETFADHALVFMVKGIKRNFKQPVAYYFTNSLDKIQLKTIIKTVATYILKSGLIIINTVCGQSSVNVSAITELVSDTKAAYLRQGKEWCYEHF